MKRVIEFGAFTTILAFAAGALAQEPAAPAAPAAAPAPAPEPAPAPAPAPAPMAYSAGGGGGMTLPGAGPAQAVAGDSDHDAVIGSFGVGYLGLQSIGVGVPATPVQAPIIGIRYWVDQMIGIDAGIGIGVHGSTQSNAGADAPQPSFTAFALHGGVPINLASAGHFNFQIVPEVNVGFANMSQDAQTVAGAVVGNKLSGSGFHFDIGARAGTEIHFGFIGLPKLSLQASVGLQFATESTKLETTPPAPAQTTTDKHSTTDFQTTAGAAPWQIFLGNIAALYYF